MGDLDRGDAKQRIRATGATKTEDTTFGGAFGGSFSQIAAPVSDDESGSSSSDAGAGRSVPMPVPITFEDFQASGGDFDVPYQIRRAPKSGYMIFLPEGCLVVDGDDVPVSKFSGVSKVSGMKGPWYSYPFQQLQAGYLNVKTEKDLSTGKVTISEVKFSNGSKQSDDGSTESGKVKKTYSVAISEIDDYKRAVQVVASSIRIVTDMAAKTDDKSVEKDEENESKLQLYKFSGTEADGNPGLVQRIKASFDDESKTVTLSSTESELMLVGRKGGKVVYIPLSGDSQSEGDGSGEDPSAESQDEVDEPDPENIDPSTPGADDPTGDPGSSNPSSDDCGEGGVSPGGGGGGGGGSKQGHSGCDDC